MFFKVNELSKQAGINLETIRYYEKIGILPIPQRGPNGYRLYTEEDVKQLNFVKTCRTFGLSLGEIKQLNSLQQNPINRCQNADELVALHLKQIDEKIHRLYEVRAILENMLGCSGDDVEHCKVINGLKRIVRNEGVRN
ncbi:MAG TPA: MerR family transcriptional regulator [Pasteurellaceae bacterium]|nr:MerR family transcriptional regulator [Pasteurellaceae bacterium]